MGNGETLQREIVGETIRPAAATRAVRALISWACSAAPARPPNSLEIERAGAYD